MLDPVESAGGASTTGVVGQTTNRVIALPAASGKLPVTSDIRDALPDDLRFLTVEPDGRDDVGFIDRLRHALGTVFRAVQEPHEAAAATDRALQAANQPLDAALSGSSSFFVQIRVVGVEVAYTDQGAGDHAAYASYRRLGIEIGVARGGSVKAEDTTVVGLDGLTFGLTDPQKRSGLVSGSYRRVETAASEPSSAAGKRLAAAQYGLARVKATQDALRAYRSGDVEPLKNLLVDGETPSPGGFSAVFPGIGALAVG